MRPDLTTAPGDLPAWKSALLRIGDELNAAVQRVAFTTGIAARDLEKQLLLHLPRFVPSNLAEAGCIESEAERLAERLLTLRAPFAHWAHQPRIAAFHRTAVRVSPCSSKVARVIHERFHYLGSFRAGHHLALFATEPAGIPMALATVSRMDITQLRPLYPSPADFGGVRVISRVFAFDWAPRNSISYLLGQVSKWIRERSPEVETLLTYLNPNLGFSGISYEASNWTEFVEVPARYAYLDANYITFRKLMRLSAARRKEVRYSQYQLEPLKILRYQLHARFELHPVVKPETIRTPVEAG